ncbi:VOC family protein [Stenotrophomonas maltophilia group sp. Smal35]|uniref:VOC family protein n=1 Tax=Stenotrophomonas maltophilia group sp. Smal35 TaxID=3377163 RepID=UPI0025543A2A|nr:VOC family protein [Stenotrophomonas maltophilia]
MNTASDGLLGIHHAALICSDYARSKDFYVRILGLRVLAENHRSARDSWKLDLALPDGGQLELFAFPCPPPGPSRPAPQRLAAHGVACEPIRVDEYTGRRFTFFADPDDLPLELYEVG